MEGLLSSGYGDFTLCRENVLLNFGEALLSTYSIS